jgi:hypothetical protein
MTPKEKAEELYSKYYNRIEHTLSEDVSVFEKDIVKHLVVIAVAEIEQALTDYGRGDSLQLQNMDSEFRYWSKVREEIQNIKTN